MLAHTFLNEDMCGVCSMSLARRLARVDMLQWLLLAHECRKLADGPDAAEYHTYAQFSAENMASEMLDRPARTDERFVHMLLRL